MKLAIDWEVETVTNTHDVVLKRMDGSVRNFRIYGRPTPNGGDTITLPVDGRQIRARVSRKSRVSLPKPGMVQSVDDHADATEIEEFV
jgi:hypothetical protein